ncbi:MAG: hypothetical protein WDA06_06540 [Phenylobacterium sp.]
MSKEKIKIDETEVEVNAFDKSNLNGKVIVLRVGNDRYPAQREDIQDIEKTFKQLLEDNNITALVFATHHALSIEIY